MIRSVTITNYRDESLTLTLDNPEASSGVAIMGIEGLGPVKANINMSKVATMDGALYNSSRADERNIVMNLAFLEAKTIEEVRQLTYKYFPIKKPLTFQIETDKRIAQTVGYVESNEPDIFSAAETATISILCPDSYFYSAGLNGSKTLVFSGIKPLFEFIWSNESLKDPLIEFSSIEQNREANIFYTGDADIGVEMKLYATGAVTNISIFNVSAQEVMRIDTAKIQKMTGKGIVAGDEIQISTLEGRKSIFLLREGKRTNILNALGRNISWFKLYKGDNIFSYNAEAGVGNLQVSVTNQILYEGV